MTTAFHTFSLDPQEAWAQGLVRLKGGAKGKATARKSAGGKAPRKQLATKAAKKAGIVEVEDDSRNEDEADAFVAALATGSTARGSASSLQWDEVSGALHGMDHYALVRLIGDHWDSTVDLRDVLVEATSDTWTTAEPDVMMEHDWVTSSGEELLLKSATPGENIGFPVTLGGSAWEVTPEEFKEIIAKEGEFRMEDEGHDMGCEECRAPGSTLSVFLEEQRSAPAEWRLRVVANTWCSCMSYHGEPVAGEDEEEIYTVKSPSSAAKSKPKRKVGPPKEKKRPPQKRQRL